MTLQNDGKYKCTKCDLILDHQNGIYFCKPCSIDYPTLGKNRTTDTHTDRNTDVHTDSGLKSYLKDFDKNNPISERQKQNYKNPISDRLKGVKVFNYFISGLAPLNNIVSSENSDLVKESLKALENFMSLKSGVLTSSDPYDPDSHLSKLRDKIEEYINTCNDDEYHKIIVPIKLIIKNIPDKEDQKKVEEKEKKEKDKEFSRYMDAMVLRAEYYAMEQFSKKIRKKK